MTAPTIQPLRPGDPSPWGAIVSVEDYGQGVQLVATAGHGGFFVPGHLHHLIPDHYRRYAARWSKGWGQRWYEEDVAAGAVMVYLPDVRRRHAPYVVAAARAALEHYAQAVA